MVAASPIFPDVRLEYFRADNAQDCPESGMLEQAVASRVGYPPFRQSAETTALVSVDRDSGTLRAVLQVTNTRGVVSGQRTLVAQRDDCAELIRLVALDISIMLEMSLMDAEQSQSPQAPAPVPRTLPPMQASPPLPSRLAPSPWRPGYGAEMGWTAGVGLGPGVANGATGAVELAWPGWQLALGLGVRAVASLPLVLSGGRRLWLQAVDVGPRACFAPGWLRACMSWRGGAFVAQPQAFAAGKTSVLPWSTVSGLLGLHVPLWRFARLGLGAELGTHVLRPRIVDNGGTVLWAMPPAEMSLSAQFAGTWP